MLQVNQRVWINPGSLEGDARWKAEQCLADVRVMETRNTTLLATIITSLLLLGIKNGLFSPL